MKNKEQFNLALWDRLKQNNIPHSFKTREGKDVTQLHKFECKSEYPIHGVCEGDVESWEKNGTYGGHSDNPQDLFIVWDEEQLILEGWLNVYGNGNANYHPTKEDAENDASTGRIACIPVKIPYTKGEGLSDG
jgi:hypothetical protein